MMTLMTAMAALSFSMVLSPLLFIFFMLFFLVGMILLLTFILNSYFYSYILFILFVSGLMILFMYVCSIIVNEKLLVNLNSLLVLSVVWGVGVFSSFFFFFFFGWRGLSPCLYGVCGSYQVLHFFY